MAARLQQPPHALCRNSNGAALLVSKVTDGTEPHGSLNMGAVRDAVPMYTHATTM